ncbi:MAG: STAS domain-containing protein [Desulfobacterales bacterium]|nr:STAS domain-containing protein [Desulfobacterales bacterium]
MELSTENIDDVTVVSLLTEVLDASNADEFKTGFASIAEESKKIILELSRVRFIDSYGCVSLLSCFRQVKGSGGDLKICRVQETVATVFELVRLDRAIDVFESREDAIKAF